MRHSRFAALAAAGLVLTVIGPPLLQGPAAGAAGKPPPRSAGITFGSPSVVDPVHTYGEPDIRVADDGTTYDSGPWGTGTQRSLWEQSTDNGRTYHVLHQAPIASPDESDSFIAGPGGGDTEISIDHQNRVYYADLAALATLKVARWDRTTRTMNTGLFGNGAQNINGVDRQWFALWDPSDPAAVRSATGYTGPFPVNYLLYTEALGSTDCNPPALGQCVSATYSTDGVSYASQTAVADETSEAPVVIDQTTGTVIEGSSTNGGGEMDAFLWTRDPANPADPSLRHVEQVKIADLPAGTDPNTLFPVTAIDTARNAYVAWVTQSDSTAAADPNAWQVWYSYATASSGWRTWSTPRKISGPPANTNIMPWATAGSDGRLAIVWYGTDDAVHNPSSDDVHQAWNVYLAVVTNADTSAPSVQQMQVTRHPMHYGSICLSGLGCIAQTPPGNRNLADFFEVTTDPRDGAIVITYDDTSNNLKQHDPAGLVTPPEQVAHTGAPLVMSVRQNGGVGLFGTSVSGPPATGTSVTDGSGDASFDPIYSSTNVPQLDLRSATAKVQGGTLVLSLNVGSLENLQNAFAATGSRAVDYVVRWSGPAQVTADSDGVTNPIWYGAVEITPGGAPSFFAGEARSIELCSVSGCFPHVLEYPEPPYGGTSVTGQLVTDNGSKVDTLVIRVPLGVVGGLPSGSVLESFGGYAFARNKPASVPLTNAEAEAGVTPVMVDGVCCVNLKPSTK
jgi:hypothetical protein